MIGRVDDVDWFRVAVEIEFWVVVDSSTISAATIFRMIRFLNLALFITISNAFQN